jgi:hypothetical protein
MPFHQDDGSPFFQIARTVLQQANFALEMHVEEPDRILGHHDRVSRLHTTFVRLLEVNNDDDSLNIWLHAICRECMALGMSAGEERWD